VHPDAWWRVAFRSAWGTHALRPVAVLDRSHGARRLAVVQPMVFHSTLGANAVGSWHPSGPSVVVDEWELWPATFARPGEPYVPCEPFA
jgi:hypothetical protein